MLRSTERVPCESQGLGRLLLASTLLFAASLFAFTPRARTDDAIDLESDGADDTQDPSLLRSSTPIDSSLATEHSEPPSRPRVENCPVCDRYGNGPCGELFCNWYECTNVSSKETEIYNSVERCASEFDLFLRCEENSGNRMNVGEPPGGLE